MMRLGSRRRTVLGIGALLATLVAARVEAAKLVVAANGADDATCGPAARPCRTIGRAIDNAAAGDTIEVGPGRYGDANGDGDLDDPGDETPEVDTGCDCMIHVTKPLAIVSRDGAGATLIHAAFVNVDAVVVDAAGSVFGKAKHGFTVMGAGEDGLDGEADRVTIAGNVATGNASDGVAADGDGSIVVANRAVANGNGGFDVQFSRGIIRGNVALANEGNGFSPDGENLIEANAAIRNGGDGFHMNGGDSTLKANAALGNGGEGFSLSDGDVLIGNVASGNDRGLLIEDDNVITKNAIVGNRGVGILAGGLRGVVTKNSIFANHSGLDLDVATENCGVALGTATPPLLTQNFWGAAAGPGVDPADQVCPLVPVATVEVDPVATKEIKVKVKAAQ